MQEKTQREWWHEGQGEPHFKNDVYLKCLKDVT